MWKFPFFKEKNAMKRKHLALSEKLLTRNIAVGEDTEINLFRWLSLCVRNANCKTLFLDAVLAFRLFVLQGYTSSMTAAYLKKLIFME